MNPLLFISSLPLRVKLGLGVAVTAAIIVGISVFAATEYSQAIQPAAGVIVETLALERAEELSAMVNDNASIGEELARNPLNVNYYNTLLTNPASATARQQIENAFQAVLNAKPTFRQVQFVNLQGKVLVSVPPSPKDDVTGEPFFTALEDHPVVNGTGNEFVGYSGGDLAPTFDFATVVTAGSNARGYVVLSVDPTGGADPSTPSIFNNLRIVSPSTGIVVFYLVDQSGGIISPSIRPITSPQAGITDPAALAKARFTRVGEFVSPVTGATVLGFVSPIDRLHMALVTESRFVQLGGSNEAGQFLLRMLVLLGIGALGVLLVALLLETTIITPMRRLLAVATAAAQGRAVSAEIKPLRQRDEVGGLYAAFIALTTQVQEDIQTLEDRIERRTRDIEATREIGQIASSIRDLDKLLQATIELIRQRFENIYHAQVFLVDARSEFAVLRTSTGEAGQKLLERGHRLAVGSQSVIGQVTATAEPVVALDTSTSTVHKANELLPETRAELALPLRSGGTVIGALDLQSKRVEAFTEADIRLFQAIADQLTIAITNAQLFEESRTRLAEIEELNRQLIGEAWRNYAGARRRRLPAASVGGPADGGNGGDAEAWSELQRRAIETGEVAERIGEDQVTVAVPVSLRGEVLGAVEWDMPRVAYNEDTRQLAQELAARLAISADNARLFEQSQRLAERERLVNAIASKLTQQTDVTQILRTAVREVGHALQVPQTSIRLAASRDPESKTD